MSMDLDGICDGPVANLAGVLTEYGHDPDGVYAKDFAAQAGVAARINGSVFAFRAGTHEDLWTGFHPIKGPMEVMMPLGDAARPHGSDQAWMTRKVRGEYLWQKEDGVYSWNRHGLVLSRSRSHNAIYWSFAGPIKPWDPLVAQVRPDLHSTYMAAYGSD
jgi:hypothetical protein